MSDPVVPTYPVDTIAKLLMLTPRRVQQLAQEGVIPRAERGRYELAPSVQGYVRYLQERSIGNGLSPIDLHTEKSRLVKAQADKAEAELAEMMDALVPAADVGDQWSHLLNNMKQRLLSVPTKAAPLLLHKESLADILFILESEITQVLTEFVQYGEGESAAPIADENSVTAAETNG